MSLFRRLLVVCSLAVLPIAALAQTFPALDPLPETGKLGAPADPSHFTFVVAGDNRPAKSGDQQPPILKKIVRDIKEMTAPEAPAFVLWSGDTIYGKEPYREELIKEEYKEFLRIVHDAGVPVFASPGNHELNAKPNEESCPNAVDQPDTSGTLLTYWEKFMSKPFGYFRFGNSAFIAVNTDDAVGPCVPLPPCQYNGYVGPAQLATLAATLDKLAADSSVAHIFVFMHRPVNASPLDPGSQLASASRDPLAAILGDTAKHRKLSVVFAAHQHLFYYYYPNQPPYYLTGPFRRTDPAGTPPAFIVSGGAGAPLIKQATSATGGYYHYLVVQVEGADVKIKVRRVEDPSVH